MEKVFWSLTFFRFDVSLNRQDHWSKILLPELLQNFILAPERQRSMGNTIQQTFLKIETNKQEKQCKKTKKRLIRTDEDCNFNYSSIIRKINSRRQNFKN